MDTTTTDTAGIALMRQFVPACPFAAAAGIVIEGLLPDEAKLRLPYRPEVTTLGTIVHGGAIATLIDMAAVAAAWSDAEFSGAPRGSTVALTVNYLAPADGTDVVATARVVRRGRRLVTVAVEASAVEASAVETPALDTDRAELVATALVTYQLG